MLTATGKYCIIIIFAVVSFLWNSRIQIKNSVKIYQRELGSIPNSMKLLGLTDMSRLPGVWTTDVQNHASCGFMTLLIQLLKGVSPYRNSKCVNLRIPRMVLK